MEAYFCFLASTGKLKLAKRFRLGKYLNDTFKAQADKVGDNINIVIAELLVLLSRNRSKFIDKVELVANYSYRHLSSKELLRSKYLIKILCTIPKANFCSKSLVNLTAKYINYIRQKQITIGENLTLEIIPFERILDIILDDLVEK